jgi:hypothetical protein
MSGITYWMPAGAGPAPDPVTKKGTRAAAGTVPNPGWRFTFDQPVGSAAADGFFVIVQAVDTSTTPNRITTGTLRFTVAAALKGSKASKSGKTKAQKPKTKEPKEKKTSKPKTKKK